MISSLGDHTTKTDCPGTYGTAADVPAFADSICLSSASDRALDTFDCAAETNPASQGKKRLCYCHEEGNILVLLRLKMNFIQTYFRS